MELIMIFSICLLLFSFIYFFNKKLIVLLIMEAFMLSLIFYMFMFFSIMSVSLVSGLILSVFMVLGSVFCICILICSSRNTTMQFSHYNSF